MAKTRLKAASKTSLPFAPVAPPQPMIAAKTLFVPAAKKQPGLADIRAAYAAPKRQSASSALADPT